MLFTKWNENRAWSQVTTFVRFWGWQEMYNYSLLVDTTEWLCIQVGRGQGDRTLGGVCGDLGLGDARWGTWGHRVWDTRMCGTGTWDIKYRDAGDMGTFIAKVGGKCNISFFIKVCYLWSTLNSIVQNHIGHLMIFTQNISLYRGKCTDYRD